MQTARFWFVIHGDVRITLQKGETLYHTHGGSTDEGWHRETHEWSFDGTQVVYRWSTDGVDCDGRLQRSGINHCDILDLKAGYRDPESGLQFPRWQTGPSRQRDFTAEAMGY